MVQNNSAQSWQQYLETELNALTPLLNVYGYSLDTMQPHTQGERFLMQNLTTISGKKLILLGNDSNNNRVVIKATRDKVGKQEISHERLCRQSLHAIEFAYQSFHSPTELQFLDVDGFTISIHEFIEQTHSFIERPLEEQFSLALQAFKTQEGARATTKRHFKTISKVFGIRNSDDYIKLFEGFRTLLIEHNAQSDIISTIDKAGEKLTKNQKRIEQYCVFLTHIDFVPHNFRIKNNTLYLLDFSSLQFGNKHEGWARFLNFMTLYNPKLEQLLIDYIHNNRSPEEQESLYLMRLYRLVEIVTYYQKTLPGSTDSLKQLNQARVQFWRNVLEAEINNKRVSRDVVSSYQKIRDELRSDEENQRQQGLH